MSRRAVLVIDDSDVDQLIIKRTLDRTGRFGPVYSAHDGREAVELYRDHERLRREQPELFPPLIVFLDINMPRLDGFSFLDEYERLGLTIEHPHFILMLSSSAAPSDIERARDHHLIDDYLVKPLTAEDARSLADRFIEA